MWLSYKVSGHYLSHFLPSCPPSLPVLSPFMSSPLRVFPPFVSFLPVCPSSLHVLPPFMSIAEAEPVCLYLLSNFPSFVGVVHSASSPLPSCLILSIMKSSIPPSLRLTNNTYHISLHGLLVRDPPPHCPAHSLVHQPLQVGDMSLPRLGELGLHLPPLAIKRLPLRLVSPNRAIPLGLETPNLSLVSLNHILPRSPS